MIDKEKLVDMRPLIEEILADLEGKINSPVMMTYHCKSKEKLQRLRDYNLECRRSYIKALAGSSKEIRNMFIEMINLCMIQIQEAEAILYSLGFKS